jgi:hypothetical protein
MTTALQSTRIYLYPEDIAARGAAQVAEQLAELGFEATAVALTYHRGRRVLAGSGRVSSLLGGGLAFTPGGGYGTVRPDGEAEPLVLRAVEDFRVACADLSIGFGAWVVALQVDDLVRTHRGLASRCPDGSILGTGLCPSRPESVEYVAALVADVRRQFEPDVIDLEAALYPGWEPAYTTTISLVDVPPALGRLLAQCFCPSCAVVAASLDLDATELAIRVQAVATATLAGETDPLTLSAEDWLTLQDLRAAGAAILVRAVCADPKDAATGTAGGATRVLGFGEAATLACQGFTAEGLAAADAVGVGFGVLEGVALDGRAQAARELLKGRPLGASLTWSPRRDLESWMRDVNELAVRGVEAISLYNYGLAPSRALAAMGEIARAWRKEHP